MNIVKKIKNKEEKIVIIGIGYVGLPLAVAFAEKGVEVIGFDLNKEKIERYIEGEDPTNEIGVDRLAKVKIEYTSDSKKIKEGKIIIVAVPTPIYADTTPDLNPVELASKIIGQNMAKGSIIIYESTVYPGVTEEVCVPILEKESKLKGGIDFKIGYSPERVNPGDKVNTVETIKKIVSGMDEETLEIVAGVYEIIVRPGVFKASSIKVAEAAKVIENSQRDINIAFMNELAIIFDSLGIDTHDVLEAAGTKWNFLKFYPGLVGGHCIGIDPYYLTYKSEKSGYVSQLILAGRQLNDSMSSFIVSKVIKKMAASNINIKKAKIAVLGLTFKENVPDLRNSKIYDVIKELQDYDIEVLVTDPWASKKEAKEEYGLDLVDLEDINDVDAVILTVAHNEYVNMPLVDLKKIYKKEYDNYILIDIKGIKNKKDALNNKFDYWRM